MVAYSESQNKSFKRRGKRLLKSKYSLYKKSKTTLLRMKDKSKISILPSTLRQSSYVKPITTRMEKSTIASTVDKVTSSSSPSSPLNLYQGTSDNEVVGNGSENKRPKKLSIKKLFGGIKERLKSPKKNSVSDDGSTTSDATSIFRKTSTDMPKSMANGSVNSTNVIVSKPLETINVLESTGSEATADTTNPNSPVRMYSDGDGENKNYYVSEIYYGNDNADENIDTNHGYNKNHDLTLSPELLTSTASSADESHAPYIFVDTDDDAQSDYHSRSDDGEKSDPNATTVDQERQKCRRNFGSDVSQEIIQVQLEQELLKLEERIKSQREERRAIAEEQLESAMAEERESVEYDNSREEIDNESNTLQISEDWDSTLDTFEKKQHQTKRLSRFAMLFPVSLLLMIHWLLSNMWATAPRYDQDNAMEQANKFFVEKGTEGLPMEGITILVSETESKLGNTIEDRFTSLGATVESLETIDCNDLNSVSESVDSLLEKLEKENKAIDFLIQTGNLCLSASEDHQRTVSKNIKSMTKKTVQGHDALFAGNYLSSFLMTQKILPHLEKSQFGTLVQFTSLASKLVDGSELDIEECPTMTSSLSCNSITGPAPVASRLLQQQKTYFSTLINLPRQFAYVKLSEILQHDVITREYPNIRTMTVSKGGWTIGGHGGVDEFFHRIFQTKENLTNMIVGGDKNEDRRDNLYEWSQNAVWKWVATPSPIAALILGGDVRQNGAVGSTTVGKTSENSLSLLRNTMVTSGALALIAMKYPGFGIWRSSWWSE